jgi:hypothetical protein
MFYAMRGLRRLLSISSLSVLLLHVGGLRWESLGAIPTILIGRFTWPNKPFLTPSSWKFL